MSAVDIDDRLATSVPGLEIGIVALWQEGYGQGDPDEPTTAGLLPPKMLKQLRKAAIIYGDHVPYSAETKVILPWGHQQSAADPCIIAASPLIRARASMPRRVVIYIKYNKGDKPIPLERDGQIIPGDITEYVVADQIIQDGDGDTRPGFGDGKYFTVSSAWRKIAADQGASIAQATRSAFLEAWDTWTVKCQKLREEPVV